MANDNSAPLNETSLREIMGGIEGKVLESCPEPSPGEADELPESAETHEGAVNPDDLDSKGNVYDPAIHTKSRAKRKNGEWKLRPNVTKRETPEASPMPEAARVPRAGAGEGAGPSVLGGVDGRRPAGDDSAQEAPQDAAPEFTLDMCKAAARPIVRQAVAGHVAFLGDDWETSKDELNELVDATALYFYSTGQMINLPPWLALTLAYGSYAAPRFQRKNTRTRLAALFAPIANFWKRRRENVKKAVDAAKAPKAASDSKAPIDAMNVGAPSFAGI